MFFGNGNQHDIIQKKYGINRAQIGDEITFCLYENRVNKNDEKGTCVFISHKSQDSEDAKAVADCIRSYGIDVYIDLDDQGLKLASVTDDSAGIVEHIQKGLSVSTHLLALISDNTRDSWWVPYEIGYAKKANKKISSLLLGNINDEIPDYLKIEETLSQEEIEKYIKGLIQDLNRYRSLFKDTNHFSESNSLSPYD